MDVSETLFLGLEDHIKNTGLIFATGISTALRHHRDLTSHLKVPIGIPITSPLGCFDLPPEFGRLILVGELASLPSATPCDHHLYFDLATPGTLASVVTRVSHEIFASLKLPHYHYIEDAVRVTFSLPCPSPDCILFPSSSSVAVVFSWPLEFIPVLRVNTCPPFLLLFSGKRPLQCAFPMGPESRLSRQMYRQLVLLFLNSFECPLSMISSVLFAAIESAVCHPRHFCPNEEGHSPASSNLRSFFISVISLLLETMQLQPLITLKHVVTGELLPLQIFANGKEQHFLLNVFLQLSQLTLHHSSHHLSKRKRLEDSHPQDQGPDKKLSTRPSPSEPQQRIITKLFPCEHLFFTLTPQSRTCPICSSVILFIRTQPL